MGSEIFIILSFFILCFIFFFFHFGIDSSSPHPFSTLFLLPPSSIPAISSIPSTTSINMSLTRLLRSRNITLASTRQAPLSAYRLFSSSRLCSSDPAPLDFSKLTVSKTSTPKDLPAPENLIFGHTFTGMYFYARIFIHQLELLIMNNVLSLIRYMNFHFPFSIFHWESGGWICWWIRKLKTFTPILVFGNKRQR